MGASNPDTPHPQFAIFPVAVQDHTEVLPTKKTTNVDASYLFFGAFDQAQLTEATTEFILSQSDASRQPVLDAIERFLSVARQDCSELAHPADNSDIIHSCWVSIQAYSKTPSLKRPQWHRDGTIFNCTCPEPKIPHSKYAFTLLGPPTLVLQPSPELEDKMHSAKQTWETENKDLIQKSQNPESRISLARSWESFLVEPLQQFDPVKLEPKQIIRFSWGQPDSPVHSGPDSSTTDRIFISILFGREDEIRSLAKHRGKQYIE